MAYLPNTCVFQECNYPGTEVSLVSLGYCFSFWEMPSKRMIDGVETGETINFHILQLHFGMGKDAFNGSLEEWETNILEAERN